MMRYPVAKYVRRAKSRSAEFAGWQIMWDSFLSCDWSELPSKLPMVIVMVRIIIIPTV